MVSHICPVCGYHMEDPPERHNICPSCGTEFGYHDSGRTHEQLRRLWACSGASWWSPVDLKPNNWDPCKQLLAAGLGIRALDTDAWIDSGTAEGDARLPTPSGSSISLVKVVKIGDSGMIWGDVADYRTEAVFSAA